MTQAGERLYRRPARDRRALTIASYILAGLAVAAAIVSAFI